MRRKPSPTSACKWLTLPITTKEKNIISVSHGSLVHGSCGLFLHSTGGLGGQGGRGIKCYFHESFMGRFSSSRSCRSEGQTGQAARGPNGNKGKDGQS